MKKLSISILLLFVMILSITAVAAADDVTSDLAKSQTVDDSAALAVDSGTNVLSADPDKNFTTVQNLVDSASTTSNLVTLKDTYTRQTTDKSILIDREITISGGALDANNLGGIFNVTANGKLTLAGVELIGGNDANGAIYNLGEVIVQEVAFKEMKNYTTIYNGGKLVIEYTTTPVTFAGDSDYAIYNEGTITTIDQAEFNGNGILNNGTIDSINNASFAAGKGIDNYATITNLIATTQIPVINNNGTITSMKGKYGAVTNNGTIGDINANLTSLQNDGEIETIVSTNITGVLGNNGTIGTIIKSDSGIINSNLGIFRNNGTVSSIDATTFTNSISNYENATIGVLENIVTDRKINNYGNILLINNVTTSDYFNNYGNVAAINNCTFEAAGRNYENASIGIISSTVFKKSLSNYENATIGLIEDSNITAKLNNDGTIIAIDNVTVGQEATINGNISLITDSVFNADVYVCDNVNIDTIDNVTFKGEFTSDNSENVTIGTIEKCVFEKKFTNDANITSIINSTFNGLLGTNHATIGTIDECVFNAALENYGDNVINTIKDTLFNNTYIKNVGNITSIEESFFNASNIVNTGNLFIGDSAFINNTLARAIDNDANLTVMSTDFINNTKGAINSKGNLFVYDSAFYANSASIGGAIRASDNLTVYDSYFINNNASQYGGAIYMAASAIAEISDSYFDNNTAPSGKAILNLGNLTLSGNTIFNATVAEIVVSNSGFITAVKITVTNNDTVYNYDVPINLTATLTDDMGNWIKDTSAFVFVINGTTIATAPKYNETTGVYSVAFKASNYADKNITNANQVVTVKLRDEYVNATADITNGTLKTIKGTFTELEYLINKTAAAGTLVLPYDFAYNAEFDNVNLTKGVVINKAIVINGNGTTIDGKGAARIFLINATTDIVELRNITFTNGVANNGAAIVANSSVRIFNSVFTNNVASANGGAIYNDVGKGKFVLVSNSKFSNNGPNAIYVNSGVLNLINNTVNKTAADIVLTKNATLNVVTLNVTVLENKTLNITYGEIVTFTAVITDENGNLINDPSFLFKVGTRNIPAIYDEGKYSFETNMYLKPGLYEVTVVYNNTGAPSIGGKNGGLNVSKESVAIVIFAKDVVAGQNATIELMAFGENGDDLNNTNVTIVVNNVPYNVTIIDGEGNITLPVLDLGTYRVYANYAGDENHNASSQVAEFGVKIATVMTISATNAGYDSALIKVTLTDASGNKLSKFVKVYVADGVYEVAVKDGEGSTLVTGLKPGAYIADAEFAFDSEYADASAQTTFTVQPAQIVVTDMKRGWNSPYDYYATLLDAKGNPVPGKEITFTIDGVTYKATTNASGIAAIAAKLDVGTHTVTVTNPDTGANSTATTTIVERIQGYGNITKDYLGPESYIVQVFGDDGNPVGENVVVEVRFAGKTYEMLTNASGYIVRTINFVPGFYAVYSVYAGYQTIQTAIVVNQILKVSAVTVKKSAKSFKLTATLKSSDGKAISGKEIKFTFGGKTYKAKTNSNGVATYKLGSAVIKKLKAGKKYTYKATYVNDIVKGKVTVKK